jgi:hypothetical protein
VRSYPGSHSKPVAPLQKPGVHGQKYWGPSAHTHTHTHTHHTHTDTDTDTHTNMHTYARVPTHTHTHTHTHTRPPAHALTQPDTHARAQARTVDRGERRVGRVVDDQLGKSGLPCWRRGGPVVCQRERQRVLPLRTNANYAPAQNEGGAATRDDEQRERMKKSAPCNSRLWGMGSTPHRGCGRASRSLRRPPRPRLERTSSAPPPVGSEFGGFGVCSESFVVSGSF